MSRTMGAISDLLNVEISRSGDQVYLRQTSYIDGLVKTFASSGVPPSFKSTDVPADESLPQLVLNALESDSVPRHLPKFTAFRSL